MDWTDIYNRKSIVIETNKLIDALILEIHKLNLPIYGDLSAKELGLLLRFLVHVSSNIFVERLMRINHQKTSGDIKKYPKADFPFKDFQATPEAILNYYYDFSFNYWLLNNISEVINNAVPAYTNESEEQPKPQKTLLTNNDFSLKNLLRKLHGQLRQFLVKQRKPATVVDYSNWAVAKFPKDNLFWFNYKGKRTSSNQEIRFKISEAAKKIFLEHSRRIVTSLDSWQYEELSALYAKVITNILPVSVVEEFSDRLKYYKKTIKNWEIKEVHSFTGYYYNENFKAFAILAKRQGAALIGHAHGIANIRSTYKQYNELAFLDQYFIWGIEDASWLKGDKELSNLKIIGNGSDFLAEIVPKEPKQIDSKNFTILYCSGPLMDFMSDLEEMSPEQNYAHRMNVLKLLKKLLLVYPGLRILYKSFPGTETHDPIKEILAQEFSIGRVKLVKDRPLDLFANVDIVFWDCISTGFAESLQAGGPVLVFQAKAEYDCSLPLGKQLYNELIKNNVIFSDEIAGLVSFSGILNDLSGFLKSGSTAIKRFQQIVASPAKRKTNYDH